MLKPRANERNIVGQQLPTLLNVTCFVPLLTLLHVVGSCCPKFEIGQTTEQTTQHFFCSLTARSIAQKCWIRLHSSSNIVGATHARLMGFKAWVKGFGPYEWLAISLARRTRTKWSFSQRQILRFSCALTFNYGDITCHVTKNWEWRKLANWWLIYIFWINKLAFMKQDKHT